MNKDQIFEMIKKNIIDVVPELSNRTITIQDSMRELGANSIDRAEILIKSMSDLQMKAPLAEFAQAKNLEELATLFLQKQQNKSG